MTNGRQTDRSVEVSKFLIEKMESNTANYIQPWNSSMPDASRPINGISGKPYRGINFMILSAAQFPDPRCYTFPQAKQVGAHVRRGEHPQYLEKWFFEKEVKNKQTGQVEKIKLDRPYSKTFMVWNASQIDGLEPWKRPVIDWVPSERAEALLQASGAWIEYREGNAAFYSPASDRVILPLRDQFKNPEFLAACSLHEISHWSGHPDRLNRDLSGTFASESYAKEELRAEIASFMLCQSLGVSRPGLDDQHAVYVKSWIKALKDDPREIFRAAADAEKIHTFVMAFDRYQKLDHDQGEDHDLEPAAPIRPRTQEREPEPARALGGMSR